MPLAFPTATRRDSIWSGRRITLMGLGRHGGGVGAARYLAAQGARVTISDAADAATLSASLAELFDAPLYAVHLGGHERRDFQDADLVVVNPAVRPDHPCLQLAHDAGVAVTSEIEIFLAACPAQVIGVSGSNGKSTTATLLAEILRTAGYHAWLGGNIGGSLLGELAQMRASDWVVLELSSFQLAHLNAAARFPRFAVITNCTPNHLDWHGTFAEYAAAKQRLLGADQAIVNAHDPVVQEWRGENAGRIRTGWELDRLPDLILPGQHNRENAACAAAAAELAGVHESTIVEAVAHFRGLGHRIEWVDEVHQRRYYNDSKSTSPGATVAALAAVEGPLWLLAGGVSKGTDFGRLAAAAVQRTQGIAVFGQAREALQSACLAVNANHPLHCTGSLHDALAWCVRQSAPGDAILLSPACASFDQYADFEHRGRHFTDLVGALKGR